MLMGVGYIVGTRIASILFSGAVMGWLLLVPLALFLNPALPDIIGSGESLTSLANEVWLRQVRPLAVGGAR